jgi:hypothetical protein
MLPSLVHGGGFYEYGRLLDDGQELLGLDVQGGGNFYQRKDLRIGFTVLDDRKIGDFHIDDRGEIRLGHFECLPTGGNFPSQCFEKCCVIAYPFFH